MRASALAVILGYSSLAVAQTQLLPTCAQACVGTDFGGCSTLDVRCICSNKELLTGLACCVSTGCDAEDQQTVIDFAQNLCRPQGVTDLPTTATCASSSATASATGTASSGTTASATATGSAASSAASSASSATSSAAFSVASSAASAAASPTAGAGMCQGNAVGMGFGLVLAGLLGAL